MEQTLTCADASRDLNESLAGSVKPADVFFLVETNATEYGGWQQGIVKKAKAGGELEHYIKHLHAVPNAKILFIRRPQSNGKNFYVAVTHQAQPKLYHCELDDYADLLQLDLDSIAPDTTPQINGQALTEIKELYAVCTNGKHDPCCSTFGIPVYNAMLQHSDADTVWQVTHIGGHRLAATLIAFPQGIYYGHLDASNAEEIITNHTAGYMVTYKYRGRGAYGAHNFDEGTHKAISAGEHHIRETAKKYAIDDLTFTAVDAIGEMQWNVSFTDNNGTQHQVTVQTAMSEPRLSSCNEDPKPMPIHTVSAYEAVEA